MLGIASLINISGKYQFKIFVNQVISAVIKVSIQYMYHNTHNTQYI